MGREEEHPGKKVITTSNNTWSSETESLLKRWGEKAFGLRWMHVRNASHWKQIDNNLSVTSIVLGSIASVTSMTSADSNKPSNYQAYIMYAVGISGLVSVICQSIKRFYNGEEKSNRHSITAKQFGSFHRTIALQLGTTRANRMSPDILGDWALTEYERIQKNAPDIQEKIMCRFKKMFGHTEMPVPDILNENFTHF